MKTWVLVLTLLLLSLATGAATADGTGAVAKGIKVGLSAATYGGNDLDAMFPSGSVGTRTGLAAGGFVTIDLGANFALQPEVLYVMKGAVAEEEDFVMRFRHDHIDLPVLLKYRFPTTGSVRPCLFAGPVASVLLSAKLVGAGFGDEPIEMDLAYGTKSADYGVALGGGLDFELSGNLVAVDLRYVLPLTGWADHLESGEDVDLDHRGWVGMIGLGF